MEAQSVVNKESLQRIAEPNNTARVAMDALGIVSTNKVSEEYIQQALAMQSELETRYKLWRWKVWVPSPHSMPYGMECYFDLGLFKIEAEITINGACAKSSFIISQERITESGSWLDIVPDLLAPTLIKFLFSQS